MMRSFTLFFSCSSCLFFFDRKMVINSLYRFPFLGEEAFFSLHTKGIIVQKTGCTAGESRMKMTTIIDNFFALRKVFLMLR